MVLPDYLEPGLDVVFCGTAAGSRSATAGHYYAGPGNRFWQMLADTGLTPKLLGPADDARLTRYGIGLTDLVKFNSGADSTLTGDMFDVARFERQVIRCAPRYVAFNGKKAAQIALRLRSTTFVRFGLQDHAIGSTRLVALPSTSGAARRGWDTAPWHELATLIRRR